MYTRVQKYSPEREVAPVDRREVDFPHRVSKSNVEAHFSFGYTEPSDGRFHTTSQKAYTHGTQVEVPESRSAILEKKTTVGAAHRARNYFLGTPEPYTSESRERLAPPPRSAYSVDEPPSIQNKKNALAMNAANVYQNDKDVSAKTSTCRSDFRVCDVSTMNALRAEAAKCRQEQQRTNYALGNQSVIWTSEARSEYGSRATNTATGKLPSLRRTPSSLDLGSQQPRTSVSNLTSQFSLGGSALDDQDGMRSVAQRDYVSHATDVTAGRRSQPEAEKHGLVFGHRGVPINSLYRESFTPTVFSTSPTPTPARRL